MRYHLKILPNHPWLMTVQTLSLVQSCFYPKKLRHWVILRHWFKKMVHIIGTIWYPYDLQERNLPEIAAQNGLLEAIHEWWRLHCLNFCWGIEWKDYNEPTSVYFNTTDIQIFAVIIIVIFSHIFFLSGILQKFQNSMEPHRTSDGGIKHNPLCKCPLYLE